MMCVTLSGCFTTHLWRPPSTEVVFEDGTVGRFRDEGAVEVPSRSWSDIGWRLLATPGFLALDLLTWPIQAFFADPEGFVSDRMKENRSASEAQPGQPE